MGNLVKINRSMWVVFSLVAVLALPAAALAFHPGQGNGGHHGFGKMDGMHRGPCGIWQNQKMVDALGLTDDQVAKLRDADFAMRARAIDLNAQKERLELKLQQAFTSSELDDAAVMGLARQLADVKGKKTMMRVETRLAVHKILTADQLKKMKALHEDRLENRHKGKKGVGKHQRMKKTEQMSMAD
jgi:Spy/CpxP family protein refolding chaperone